MRKIDVLLQEYAESHQNSVNKLLHWVCIPAIFFTIYGLIRTIPVPNWMYGISSDLSWASLILSLALVYYIVLSLSLSIGFMIWAIFVFLANEYLYNLLGSSGLLLFSVIVFVIAWIGQFIGHGIEGKKPSFLKDIQFLLIGPAWLMSFVYKKMGISL